jgi:hypothetical protein
LRGQADSVSPPAKHRFDGSTRGPTRWGHLRRPSDRTTTRSAHDAAAPRRASREYQRSSADRNALGRANDRLHGSIAREAKGRRGRRGGAAARWVTPTGVSGQRAGASVHRGGGRPPGLRRGRPGSLPERRCGIPSSPCTPMLAASDSRVRLNAFEEYRSQPRCTGSHPERMRPHPWLLLERTPLLLRAQFGSSRVREDLPRPVPRSRPIWLRLRESFAHPHRHPSSTLGTRRLMRSVRARPRISSNRAPQRTTSPYSSDRNRSIRFSDPLRDFSPRIDRGRGRGGFSPRPRAGELISLHSRALGAG